mgnify:CR=1 FL=1
MKTSINYYEFEKWFTEHRPNNFSHSGLRALFDYLEQYEEDTDESIEFDPIALCCEYTEYDDLKEFQGDYTAEEYQVDDYRKLDYYTQVIPIDKESFIILAF